MITYCPRCGTEWAETVRGEWLDAAPRCIECSLTVAEPPAMLAIGDPDDEVQYDLGEWETGERAAATSALLAAEIPYRWEAALVLTVPAVAEGEVDVLLDELEEVEALDDDAGGGDGADGGEEAHDAMVELFVAADRLQHDPLDANVAADVLVAAGTVSASLPPYGIERPVWRRIQALAAAVATDLEEMADEETVAADARALREFLRDLV